MNFSLLKDVEPEEPENEDVSETPSANASEESPESPDSSIEVPSEDEETEFVAQERKPTNQSALMLFAILLIGGAGIYAMYLRIGVKSAHGATASVDDAQGNDLGFHGQGQLQCLAASPIARGNRQRRGAV